MKVVFVGTLLVVVFFLNSCSFLYIPSAPVVFNHQNKGDLSVDFRQGGYSTSLQGGYAVTENFNAGVSLSSLYTGDVIVVNTLFEGSNQYDINFMGGYYTKLSENVLFEVNAGGGPILFNDPTLNKYAKLYVQPTFGFKSASDVVVFNIGVRALGTSLNYNDSQQDTLYYSGYIEPFLSLSAGKTVHFLMQTGVSLPMIANQFGTASPFLLNIGLGYSLGATKKNKTITPSF